MATVIQPFVAVDGNGNVRASAKLYFYLTGTTTPQNTYADAALSAVNTNPVVADSNGLFAAIYLGDPPTFSAYKAILKTSADVTVWTTDPIAGAPITSPISAALLRGYLSGLQLTSRTNTTLSDGAGVATDSSNTVVMSLISGTINAATVGANGLDAGALAVTTTYHRFAIGKTDGSTARVLSTSPSSPTMPSGYTYFRRVGSFRTNVSAQIVDHVQDGDNFGLVTLAQDINVTNPGVSAVTRTLSSVPTGLQMIANVQAVLINAGAAAASGLYLSDLATTDSTPALSGTVITDVGSTANATGSSSDQAGRFLIRTNTSGQIRSRQSFSDANCGFVINTLGWIDRRGRDT